MPDRARDGHGFARSPDEGRRPQSGKAAGYPGVALPMSDIPVVTIDGPSGSGKGTVGRRIAAAHGWHFLDSGALYRILAHEALRQGVPLDDADALARLAGTLRIGFPSDSDAILVDGRDVSRDIRSEAAGEAASKVAALPEVREALLALQRGFRQPPGLVADGRDMGTVVFPDAPVKVFLDASAETRAERRCKQLEEKGIPADYDAILADIRQRDERDRNRPVAPLRPAPDARALDSTGQDPEATVAAVEALIRERLGDV